MEEIRAFACDELLQLSHGGHEVGGILFGTRRDDLIRILTWRPIACEHTQGEGLRLSYNDRMNLAVQLEVARQNPDLKDLRPVGWFLSHSRGTVSLSDSDLEIYNGFFPEAWQAALVICPQGSGRAQAGFFMREADAKVQAEASYQSFDLAPLRPAAAAPPQPPQVAKPKEPEVTKPRPTPSFHAQAVQAPPLEAPSFQIEEQLPTHERWYWAIPILLALGIAAFLLYQREAPSANASIALRASSEGQTVQLAWDGNSRVIRDSFRGEIGINDGGKSSQVSLTSDDLHAGKMSYLRQSSDVGFALTIYPANGDPVHDSTRLIAPAFDAPTQPPQLIPATPAPASPAPATPAAPPAADQSALQQQVQRLRDDLGKERARANELQNLVRILENRLGIQSEAATSAPSH